MVEHERVNLEDKDYYSLIICDDLSWGAHFHHAIEFCYVIDGEADFTIDGITYTATDGEAVVSMPNQIHSIKTEKTSKIQIIRIRPDLAGSFYSDHKHKVPVCSKFKVSNSALIGYGVRGIGNTNVYTVKALVYMLASDLSVQCEEWIERPAVTNIISEMVKIADTDFSTNLSLRDIAEKLNYNYAYISTEFRRVMGMTFKEYLNNCRINHACWLLKNSDLSITDVAHATGYDSIRSFNRNFIKYNEVTPVEYRNSMMI